MAEKQKQSRIKNLLKAPINQVGKLLTAPFKLIRPKKKENEENPAKKIPEKKQNKTKISSGSTPVKNKQDTAPSEGTTSLSDVTSSQISQESISHTNDLLESIEKNEKLTTKHWGQALGIPEKTMEAFATTAGIGEKFALDDLAKAMAKYGFDALAFKTKVSFTDSVKNWFMNSLGIRYLTSNAWECKQLLKKMIKLRGKLLELVKKQQKGKLTEKEAKELMQYEHTYDYLQKSIVGSMVMVEQMKGKKIEDKKIREFLNNYANIPRNVWSHGVHQDIFFEKVSFTYLLGFYYLAGYTVLSGMKLSEKELTEKYDQYRRGIDALLSQFLSKGNTNLNKNTDIEDWVEDILPKHREDFIAIGLSALASLTSPDLEKCNLTEKIKEVYGKKDKLFTTYKNALNMALEDTKLKGKVTKTINNPKNRYDMEVFMLFDFAKYVMDSKNRQIGNETIIKTLAYKHAMSVAITNGTSKTAKRLAGFLFNALMANAALEYLTEKGKDQEVVKNLISLALLDVKKKQEFMAQYRKSVETVANAILNSIGINLNEIDGKLKNEYIATAIFLPPSYLEENKGHLNIEDIRSKAKEIFGITGSELVGMILEGTSPEGIIMKTQDKITNSKLGQELLKKGYNKEQIAYIAQYFYPQFLYFFLNNPSAKAENFLDAVEKCFPSNDQIFSSLQLLFSEKKLMVNLNVNPSVVAATAVNIFATIYYNTEEAKKQAKKMEYMVNFASENEANAFVTLIGCGRVDGNTVKVSLLDYKTKIEPQIKNLKQIYARYCDKKENEVTPGEMLSILGGIATAAGKAGYRPTLTSIGDRIFFPHFRLSYTDPKQAFLADICKQLGLTLPGKTAEYKGAIVKGGNKYWYIKTQGKALKASYLIAGPFFQALEKRITTEDLPIINTLLTKPKHLKHQILDKYPNIKSKIQNLDNIEKKIVLLLYTYHGLGFENRGDLSYGVYTEMKSILMEELKNCGDWKKVKSQIEEKYGKHNIMYQATLVVDELADKFGAGTKEQKIQLLAALLSLPAGVLRESGMERLVFNSLYYGVKGFSEEKISHDRKGMDYESMAKILLFAFTNGKYSGLFFKSPLLEKNPDAKTTGIALMKSPLFEGINLKGLLEDKNFNSVINTTIKNLRRIDSTSNAFTLIISTGTTDNSQDPIIVNIKKIGDEWVLDSRSLKKLQNMKIPLTSTLMIVKGSFNNVEDLYKQSKLEIKAHTDLIYILSNLGTKIQKNIFGVYTNNGGNKNYIDAIKCFGISIIDKQNYVFSWKIKEGIPLTPVEVTAPQVEAKQTLGIVNVKVPMILPSQPNLPYFVPPVIVNQTQYTTDIYRWIDASVSTIPGATTIPGELTLNLLESFGQDVGNIPTNDQTAVRNAFFQWACGDQLTKDDRFITNIKQNVADFYVSPAGNGQINITNTPQGEGYVHFKLYNTYGDTRTYAVYEKVGDREWLIGYVDYTYDEKKNVTVNTRVVGSIVTHTIVWEEFNKMIWFGYLFGNPVVFNISGSLAPQLYTYYKEGKKLPSKLVAFIPSFYISPMVHTTVPLPFLEKELQLSTGLPTYFSIGGGPVFVPYAGLGMSLLSTGSVSANLSVGGSLYKTGPAWSVLPQYNMNLSVKIGETTYLTFGPNYVASGIFGFRIGMQHVSPEGRKGISLTCFPSISYLPIDVEVNGISLSKKILRFGRHTLDWIGFDEKHSVF